MKKDYTHIMVILDRSGSMSNIVSDTIGGYNEFIQKQKQEKGIATLSLVLFDDQYDVVYRMLKLHESLPLTKETYWARGSTALYDAIGRTITEEGELLAGKPESERPEKVLCVIITDGHENMSSKYPASKIKEMIKHQTEKYNWEFVFMGANQDAILSGKELNIGANNSLTFGATAQGMSAAFNALNNTTAMYRATGSVSFSDADRKKQEELIST